MAMPWAISMYTIATIEPGERLAVCHSYEWCCGLDLKVPVHVGWVAQCSAERFTELTGRNFQRLQATKALGFWSTFGCGVAGAQTGQTKKVTWDVSLPDPGKWKKRRLRIGSDFFCVFFFGKMITVHNRTILMNILLLWLLFPVPLMWDLPRNNPGRVTASRVGLQFTSWDFGGGFWGEKTQLEWWEFSFIAKIN